MAGPHRGRGVLSSMEQLPESCDEHLTWAKVELSERNLPQTEILREFNARIADHGQKPISKGAFSRFSVKAAIELRKRAASLQIMDAVLERMAPGERSASTLAATELVKYRIVELVMSEDEIDPKLLGQASLALQRLSSTALREAEGQRKDARYDAEQAQAEQDRQRAEAEETATIVESIATEAGLGATRIAELRREFLGVRT